MSPAPSQNSGSILLAEEYFAAEDPRFLEAIRAVRSSAALAGFVDRWKRDPRPYARQQILAYLLEPLDAVGHNVIVKRLFKQAEAVADDELMAAFLVAFDLLVRRVRRTRYRYDWQSRQSWTEERLIAPRDVLPREVLLKRRNPWTGDAISLPLRTPKTGRLFSHRTRNYLRRRAWRYFRKLGYQHTERYVPAISRALAAYKDADLAKGEHILDSWGLLHACFSGHAALEFSAARIRLKEGRAIGELTPAPRFATLWRTPDGGNALLTLTVTARSRFVRFWAMEMLERECKDHLVNLAIEHIFRLLENADDEVQQFGGRLLESSGKVAKLPVATWLKLLSTQNTLALEAVCRTFERHVSADRLTLADCVRLACAMPAPVARMGMNFLRARQILSVDDRKAISQVADARCLATAGELATWALGILGTSDAYDRDLILHFFDSHSAPVRQAGWQWLVGASNGKQSSPGYGDAGLWCRLLETPYDDLRLPMVDELARRASLPGAGTDDLTPVWCSVLLGVHRGGRQKPKATRQIARALVEDPSRAEILLPVLAAAVRSVRPAEARAGLAAVVAAVASCPELESPVRKYLPELRWEAT